MTIAGMILSLAVLAAPADGGQGPAREDRASYDEAARRAGDDPGANVRLALWCEARGMSAERDRHLEAALRASPDLATARGLLGQVRDGDAWRTPAEAEARARGDAAAMEALARYRERRETLSDTAESHRRLAEWSEEHGLAPEALAHRTAVVRLAPAREEAWKALGYKKQNNRWTTPQSLAAERAEADAQRKADARWLPLLQKWKLWLGQKAKSEEAEAALAAVADPRAVPSVWKVFAAGRAEDQVRALTIFERIDDPAATRDLALLAVSGASADIRARAARALARRDHRECDALLIGLLREAIVYEVKPVGGPGSPGELYVKGKRLNNRQFYAAPPPLATFQPGDVVGLDPFGLPVATRNMGYMTESTGSAIAAAMPVGPDLTGLPDMLARSGLGSLGQHVGQQAIRNRQETADIASRVMSGGTAGGRAAPIDGSVTRPIQAQVPVGQLMLQAQQQAEFSRRRLNEDVAAIERHNEAVDRLNERVAEALASATGERLGMDRTAWGRWWAEGEESLTSAAPRPADPGREPAPTGVRARAAGLGAGTPVRTRFGPRPVEDLRAGDEVLTQDAATGALGFAPVLAIRRTPPGPAVAIAIGDTALIVTELERLWVAGKGWVMARDLAPGDVLRTLGGTARVVSVEATQARPTFHVRLAEGQGLFVGGREILAHDERPARTVVVPFDAPAAEPPRPADPASPRR